MSYENWTTVLMVAGIMTYLLICYDDIINVMSKLLVILIFILFFKINFKKLYYKSMNEILT